MANKITLYTVPGCVYCQMVKDFFRQNNISYEEKDVLVDDEAREEMVEKSGQLGAPVIDINGRIIVGFNEAALLEALGISNDVRRRY